MTTQKHHPGAQGAFLTQNKQRLPHIEHDPMVIVQMLSCRFNTPQEFLYCTSYTVPSAGFFAPFYLFCLKTNTPMLCTKGLPCRLQCGSHV